MVEIEEVFFLFLESLFGPRDEWVQKLYKRMREKYFPSIETMSDADITENLATVSEFTESARKNLFQKF